MNAHLRQRAWCGERCGRRRHARREDKCESCTRRAAAAKQSCTRRAATAKPGRGRRGRRTAGELAHRRGAQGHRRQWSRPQWGVRVWTLASLGEGEGGVKAIGRPGSQVGSSVGRSVDQEDVWAGLWIRIFLLSGGSTWRTGTQTAHACAESKRSISHISGRDIDLSPALLSTKPLARLVERRLHTHPTAVNWYPWGNR